MWLLDAATFLLCSVHDPSQVRYAALSHVWDERGEPSFQDIQAMHAEIENTLGSDPDEEQVQAYLAGHTRRIFWSKIWAACAFARAHGYQYIWIDACCINKMSSAELSEAVNSMFQWYAQATVCYAYLHDVPDHEHPARQRSKFRSSKWFKRGWTLQELVAPRVVVFLSRDWSVLGTKHVLAPIIAEITRISRGVLCHDESLDSVSVAERMSWASERQTTRVEDEAYSLLGIFGIHMPTIYGEGSQAFVRLQEEILRRIPDQSLFAWGSSFALHSPSDHRRLLVSRVDTDPSAHPLRAAHLFASSTTEFYNCTGLSPISLQEFSQCLSVGDIRPPEYITTSYGLRTRLPIMQLNAGEFGDDVGAMIAPLACRNSEGSIPALVLSPEHEPNQYSIGGYTFEPGSDTSTSGTSALRPVFRLGKRARFLLLHQSVLDYFRTSGRVAHWKNIYVLHRPPRLTAQSLRFTFATAGPPQHNSKFAGQCNIVIPSYIVSELSRSGYAPANVSISHGSPIAVRHIRRRYTLGLLRSSGTVVVEHISISLSLCGDAAFPLGARPLHAAVKDWWVSSEHPRSNQPDSRSFVWDGIDETLTNCKQLHVQDWEDAERVFVFGRLGKSVRLKFSEWYLESRPLADRGVYEATPRAAFALNIMVIDQSSQIMGSSSHISSNMAALTPSSMESQSDVSSVMAPTASSLWNACPWETPPLTLRLPSMDRRNSAEEEAASTSDTSPYSEPRWTSPRDFVRVDTPLIMPTPDIIEMFSPGPSDGFISPNPRRSQFDHGLNPPRVPPIRSILKSRPPPSPRADVIPPPSPSRPGIDFVPPSPSPSSSPIPGVSDDDEYDGEYMFPNYPVLDSDALTEAAATSGAAIPSGYELIIGDWDAAHMYGAGYGTASGAAHPTASESAIRPMARPLPVQWGSEPEIPHSILSDASYRYRRDPQAQERRVRFQVAAKPTPW